jgi:hypothetical protein
MRYLPLSAILVLGACATRAQMPTPAAVPAPAVAPAPAAPVQQRMQYSQEAEANDLFLRGQDLLAHSDPRTGGTFANAREAIRLFEQAIDRDPRFALAHVQIARAWMVQGYSNPDAPPADEIETHSRASVNRALQIDPNLPEAHQLLAQIYYLTDYDWAGRLRTTPTTPRRIPGLRRFSPAWAASTKRLSRRRSPMASGTLPPTPSIAQESITPCATTRPPWRIADER